MPKVSVAPFGKEVSVSGGKTVLDALDTLNIPIDVICAGKGTCGKCKVIVADQSNVSELSEIEKGSLSKRELAENTRLACMTRVNGDVSVYVPEFSLQRELRILSKGQALSIECDPAARKVNLLLPRPALGDHVSYEKLIVDGLGLDECKIDFFEMRGLFKKIKESGFDVDVTYVNGQVVNVSPHPSGKSYGLAMDIGSTTVVIYLIELCSGKAIDVESCLNPQVRYGEDVISRITHAMNNGVDDVHDILVDKVNMMIGDLCKRNDVDAGSIPEMTVVGNTVMHHIFLKLDPTSISLSPFTPAVAHALDIPARDVGIAINPSANIHVLPVIAGFVGADTMGVLLATEIYNSDEMALAIDIGTNGELVLGNSDRMVSCSCAAGPALEGGELRFGMRASPGAIEDVRIIKGSYDVEYRTIGNKSPVGICGSGIVDVVAEMLKVGLLDISGKLLDNGSERLRQGANGQLEFVLEWAESTGIGEDIVVSAGDIREVQLAKGAIYAGEMILMQKMGITERDIDRIFLAGAFGNYIDTENAIVMGLLPNVPLERIMSVGNAAGEGAKLSLISSRKRSEEDWLSRKVQYYELASEGNFQDVFIDSLSFPSL